MEYWFLNNSLTMAIAFLLTGILIPQILAIAYKLKLFDSHDERKIHKGAVPRLGGIAFVPSIIFSVLLIVGIGFNEGEILMVDALRFSVIPLFFLLCSLMLLFLVGIADDLIGVRYRSKFLFQIFCSVLTVVSGATVVNLYGLFGLWGIPSWLGWIITAFMVVYIINALNLIDGIDGLCSGLAIIALFFYGAVFYFNGYYIYSMLAWATVGTLVPFFYFNMFGQAVKRKKIFMGDTGSLTIGMMIVFLSLEIMRLNVQVKWIPGVNPIITAFAPLILPLFDVIRVFNHRVRKHSNPFLPDRSHIHHKLLALGFSQRKSLGLILLGAVVFFMANLLASPYVNVNLLIIFDVLVWSGANVILTRAIRRRERKTGQTLYD